MKTGINGKIDTDEKEMKLEKKTKRECVAHTNFLPCDYEITNYVDKEKKEAQTPTSKALSPNLT